jgi:hypothetical protein
MKPLRFSVFLSVLLAALAFGFDKVVQVTLPDLAKEPKAYDNKTIETSGVVADFKQKTSRAGNKYFTFKLRVGEKETVGVSVYSQGEAEEGVKDGAKVKVVGVFREEKKVYDFTVKNEIDATKVKDKENGVKVVK